MVRRTFVLGVLLPLAFGAAPICAAHAVGTPVHHPAAITAAQDAAVREYWSASRIANMDPVPDGAGESLEAFDGGPWTTDGMVTSTVGRLFFSKATGDESCTATIVHAHNQSVAVTAAHCVRDTNLDPARPIPGDWTNNVLFAPGFRVGTAPFGFFTVREVIVSRAWVQPAMGFLNSDYAFLILNRDAQGRTIGQAVGGAHQRIAFGTAAPVALHQFGYPRFSLDSARENQPAFRGQRLAACWGVPQIVNNPGFGLLRSEGVPCTMGSGASGGPHFVDFDTVRGVGTVVGVNSYLGMAREGETVIHLMGPPLGREAQILYEEAQRVRV